MHGELRGMGREVWPECVDVAGRPNRVAWHYFSSNMTTYGSKLNTKCGVIDSK